MIYEFELGNKTTETTKSICCMKGKGVIDHGIVTRWFKKFRSGCKNLEN